MSDATNATNATNVIELLIKPRERDLGDFKVRRVLPYAKRRTVGPFIFFDHMGPVTFDPGKGIDVRPHPHICLATVTYLFDGEIRHRDSLGHVQDIRPGDVNWMTAGKGIVHSERTGDDVRKKGHTLHGLQIWVGLPKKYEETEPAFFHHAKDKLPKIEQDGVKMRLVIGEAFGEQSPVEIFSPMFYLDAQMPEGTRLVVPDEYEERAFYVAAGEVTVNGETVGETEMAVLTPKAEAQIRAQKESRLMILGGPPLDGERRIYWNFVASSQERIEKAKQDWREGRFPTIPGDDKEFIPLPEDKNEPKKRAPGL